MPGCQARSKGGAANRQSRLAFQLPAIVAISQRLRSPAGCRCVSTTTAGAEEQYKACMGRRRISHRTLHCARIHAPHPHAYIRSRTLFATVCRLSHAVGHPPARI